MGSIPGQGTKIMHMSHSVGKKKKVTVFVFL